MTRIILLSVLCVTCVAISARDSLRKSHTDLTNSEADGLVAWQQVYSVLTSPRCINCRTATNYPQQGDDRHRHFANIIRGPEGGRGAGIELYCCHQSANADSTGVPGGTNWHLAPLSMRWQDENDQPLSSAVVCRSLTDRTKNGGLNAEALLKHHEEEPLVLWAWNPGRRQVGAMRTLPPLTHGEFVAATRHWIAAGITLKDGRVEQGTIQSTS
jgi:hypothetical protein